MSIQCLTLIKLTHDSRDNFRFKIFDLLSTVSNSYASTNGNLTNTVANQYREIELDLTNATGQINGFAVSAGDILKVELTRATGTTDTADVRMLPSGTEFKIA